MGCRYHISPDTRYTYRGVVKPTSQLLRAVLALARGIGKCIYVFSFLLRTSWNFRFSTLVAVKDIKETWGKKRWIMCLTLSFVTLLLWQRWHLILLSLCAALTRGYLRAVWPNTCEQSLMFLDLLSSSSLSRRSLQLLLLCSSGSWVILTYHPQQLLLPNPNFTDSWARMRVGPDVAAWPWLVLNTYTHLHIWKQDKIPWPRCPCRWWCLCRISF